MHSGGESLRVFVREFANRLTDLFLCGLIARVDGVLFIKSDERVYKNYCLLISEFLKCFSQF